MTVSLKHSFASAQPDGSDTSLVQPSNWNAEHTLTLGANVLLGAVTAGAAQEIGLGAGLSFSAGNLTVSGFAATAHTHIIADVTGLQPALDGKEATITAGTTAQYWRGDKSFQTLDKTAVGLANVDNTSDANKPVSSATTTALNLRAPIASPTFTGTVSGVTAAMVGLGNVNNTSDADKPVSTAQSTAIGLKLDAAAVSAFGLTLVDDANAAAARTTLGLATVAATGSVLDLNPIFQLSVLGNANGTPDVIQEISFGDFGNLIPVFDDIDNGTVPASGGGTTKFLRADATWVVPPGGGGGGATYGTATIDFGAYPGSNEATVAFTDASVPSGAKVLAFIASDATTADHTANDHKYAPLFIHLTAQPNAGVGGNIYARSLEKMQGEFAVRYQWAA